jgi:nicotinamide phosphoribosyltransferase
MFFNNIILSSDSYKYSMPFQYPGKTEYVYSYIEARGGQYKEMMLFGVQAYIEQYLMKPITQEDIDEAEEFILAHGEPFYREGWEYILKHHSGYLPLKIKSAEEGAVIPVNNVLVTIENTDPKCWWLPTFIETSLLRATWYCSSVATNSFNIKKLILKYLEKTGTPIDINFKLHDFGNRGCQSQETAALGGMSHLVNFKGTDTVPALVAARKFYRAKMAGFSIPASEHSTITSWGRENEVEAFRNMLKQFGKPGQLLACVSDSFNIYDACSILWGEQLKEEVINSGATVVIRPDSGKPSEVVLICLQLLEQAFGSIINSKGYRVLNHVRVLQGDGIQYSSIEEILKAITQAGFSTDNVAFGMGGKLLGAPQRDDGSWAMKCSAICINGEWKGVVKDPITDAGKRSKQGRVVLYYNDRLGYYSGVEDWNKDAMNVVYYNGTQPHIVDFEQVRNTAECFLED